MLRAAGVFKCDFKTNESNDRFFMSDWLYNLTSEHPILLPIIAILWLVLAFYVIRFGFAGLRFLLQFLFPFADD